MMEYKQLIIARKDLLMHPGKLAAQVSHASMAFLTSQIKKTAMPLTNYMLTNFDEPVQKIINPFDISKYEANIILDKDTYEKWINGSFTKIVCEARNKNHLLRAIEYAKSVGLYTEGYDYFLIRDNCLTDLTPEDEDGRTLTCIGFRPLPFTLSQVISRHYQLYR